MYIEREIYIFFFWGLPLDIQPGSLGRAGDFSLGVPLYAHPSLAGRSGSRRKSHTRGCRGESVAWRSGTSDVGTVLVDDVHLAICDVIYH